MKICTNNIILTTAQYVCDALGRRVRKTSYDAVPSVATLYYYSDNWQVLAEYNGSGVQQAYYIFGNYIDEVLLMNRGGADKYYLHDHLYSPVALLNASSNVLERYEYDAYGKVQILTSAFSPLSSSQYGNTYYFTGRELDTLDAGSRTLMYYRARTYDSETGRFMQRDPHGINPAGGEINPFDIHKQYADDANIYEYVQGNPINKIDSYGFYSYQWGGLKWDGNTCNCKNFSSATQRRTMACAMRSASNSCKVVDQHISDPELAACIKKQCEKQLIKCSTDKPKDVGGTSAGWGITMFIGNFGTDGSWGFYTAGDVAIHEFAHECGWSHHHGKGVPDPLGDIARDLQSGKSSWGIKCQ